MRGHHEMHDEKHHTEIFASNMDVVALLIMLVVLQWPGQITLSIMFQIILCRYNNLQAMTVPTGNNSISREQESTAESQIVACYLTQFKQKIWNLKM